jgi:hypothetical protein
MNDLCFESSFQAASPRSTPGADALSRSVHRHFAVFVAVAAIGDPSMQELQRVLGRSRRAVQDILRDLRQCNVVIQSHQARRRFSFRLISEGPISVRGASQLIQQRYPELMNRILAVKAQHEGMGRRHAPPRIAAA